MSELRHLEYVLQKGIENLDSRETQISKLECEAEKKRQEIESMRAGIKDETDTLAAMKSDLQKNKKVQLHRHSPLELFASGTGA